MSGLSASTYSCGGDAGRFGGGGDAASAAGLGFGLKYFFRPILRFTAFATASSSVD